MEYLQPEVAVIESRDRKTTIFACAADELEENNDKRQTHITERIALVTNERDSLAVKLSTD